MKKGLRLNLALHIVRKRHSKLALMKKGLRPGDIPFHLILENSKLALMKKGLRLSLPLYQTQTNCIQNLP